MYELEVNHDRVSGALLPAEVKARFFDEAADITAISLIPWEEHCTECAMPACFATCDQQEEGKQGGHPVAHPSAISAICWECRAS